MSRQKPIVDADCVCVCLGKARIPKLEKQCKIEIMRWSTRRASQPSPQWREGRVSALAGWSHLTRVESDRLEDQAWHVTRHCRWEGLDGLDVTPHMQGVISAEACLLSVNIGLSIYRDVTSILIAPTVQNRITRQRMAGPVVAESSVCVLGESLLHGPVRLAWDQIVADRSRPASVIIHEFSHKIDMADGYVDGEPPLSSEAARMFEKTVNSAMESLRSSSDLEPLSEYALTNRAEFFACVSEAFFLRSNALQERFGDLYAVLRAFYRQDPIVSDARPRRDATRRRGPSANDGPGPGTENRTRTPNP